MTTKTEHNTRIESLIRLIEDTAFNQGVEPSALGRFWHWLGNIHYASANGDLTEPLALEIVANMGELIREWRTTKWGTKG